MLPPYAPFHALLWSWRSRASSPYPKGQLPGPWVNAACVCAADILLGHKHDFRVKHLSEALNDKHGPLDGEYCGPAADSPRTACSALRTGLACDLAPTSVSFGP